MWTHLCRRAHYCNRIFAIRWASSTAVNAASQSQPSALNFDVVVVGGGHAGCESAAAAARCGSRTLLITHKIASIGEMSCSPSFGGVGKGQLIREVDALDGVCGRICDKSAINYQALNRSRGPAVLGLRAQIDRKLYKKEMQEEILRNTPNLSVIEASVEDLLFSERDTFSASSFSSDSNASHKILGCVLQDGTQINTNCIVITTGTFLNAEIFRGLHSEPGGRIGESASYGLARTFRDRLKLRCGRLRTGTPPRLVASTIDFSQFERLPPDEEPIMFSYLTEKPRLPPSEQISTYVGYTNQKLVDLVLATLKENNHIKEEVTGARSCPSLEAKVLRFPHLSHRFFLEPEGFDAETVYPGSFGLSSRADSQLEILRKIPGLERVEMSVAGYGVHYDFVNPQQLKRSLEVKAVDGLFLAGQINGTTGYEEAAGQGIISGICAARKAEGKSALELDRSQGYIGVLIDDLTSLGTNEPYRMYTSRVEFRIYLRTDNADFRLTELGRRHGAVGEQRYASFCETRERFLTCKQRMESLRYNIEKWNDLLGLTIRLKPKAFNAFELMARHHAQISIQKLAYRWPELFSEFMGDQTLEDRLKNEGRYSLQDVECSLNIEEIRRDQTITLPDNLRYWEMPELSLECREKLDQLRPQNIAAAARIPGITPDALVHILRHVEQSKIHGNCARF